MWKHLSVLEKCQKDWFIFNHTPRLHYHFKPPAFSDTPFFSYLFVSDFVLNIQTSSTFTVSISLPLPELIRHCVVRCTVRRVSRGSLKLQAYGGHFPGLKG